MGSDEQAPPAGAAVVEAADGPPMAVFIAEDIRRVQAVSCAAPGCYAVAYWASASAHHGVEDRRRAVAALSAAGWRALGDDVLCPPHRDRW